mgnify:CR=1 FL=1
MARCAFLREGCLNSFFYVWKTNSTSKYVYEEISVVKKTLRLVGQGRFTSGPSSRRVWDHSYIQNLILSQSWNHMVNRVLAFHDSWNKTWIYQIRNKNASSFHCLNSLEHLNLLPRATEEIHVGIESLQRWSPWPWTWILIFLLQVHTFHPLLVTSLTMTMTMTTTTTTIIHQLFPWPRSSYRFLLASMHFANTKISPILLWWTRSALVLLASPNASRLLSTHRSIHSLKYFIHPFHSFIQRNHV